MPQPLLSLSAIALPLPQANIDTDQILPAKFLKTIERKGLGHALFHTMRFKADGLPNPNCLLNQEPWSRAEIIVGHENFGSGSSREHAPWALLDFGVRAILAPGFADIFRQNCIKNGILPGVMDRSAIDRLIATISRAETARLTIDIEAQTVRDPSGETWRFGIDEAAKAALISGEDDITRSLAHMDAIRRHFAAREAEHRWLRPIHTI